MDSKNDYFKNKDGVDILKNSSKEQQDMDVIIQGIHDIVCEKRKKYRIPPVNYMDIDLLLSQIEIKALRARQTIDPNDTVDELQDVIVYSLHALRRFMEISPEINADFDNKAKYLEG